MKASIRTAISNIISNHPSPVFGGSIALASCGLLDREIQDIDLIFPWVAKGEIDLFFMDKDSGEPEDGSIDIEGVHRLSTTIDSIKTCCFYVPKDMMQTMPVNYMGKDIVIQKPVHAVQAKITYSWHGKHYRDLLEIRKNLNGIKGFEDCKKAIEIWIKKREEGEEVTKKLINSFVDELPF